MTTSLDNLTGYNPDDFVLTEREFDESETEALRDEYHADLAWWEEVRRTEHENELAAQWDDVAAGAQFDRDNPWNY